MNPPKDPASTQPARQPLSDAAKASLLKTHNLFRTFIVTVLGSFFVYQVDVTYLWLTAILTTASIVLGNEVLVRAIKLKESKLVLFGTISGLVVSAVMVLLILASAVFFNQVRDFQQCSRSALTQQAMSQCQTQLEKSLPTQLR
jgi:phosphoglycerol transferase MdoB-like AlkP superfamily enzyme